MNAWTDTLQHPLVLRLGWTLLHFLWQGAIVGGIAGTLVVALRRQSPQARYLTLLGLLGIAVTCPLGTFLLLGKAADSPAIAETHLASIPAPAPERLPPVEWVQAQVLPGQAEPTDVAAQAHLAEPANQSPARDAGASPMSPISRRALPWLVVGWCCGVTLLALRMLGGWWKASGLTSYHVQPVTDAWQDAIARLTTALQIRRKVRWLESSVANVPLTIGWLRPVVVLPTSVLTGLPRAEVECLLAHELAHIRRHDYLVNLLQCVIEVLLFYHPVVWWLSGRVRQEREQVCDALAVSVTGDRMAYSRALLSVAGLATQPSSLAVAANGGVLKERVQRVLGIPVTPVRSPVGAALACILLVLGSTAYLLAIPNDTGQSSINGETMVAGEQSADVETFSDGEFRLLPIAGRVVDRAGQPVAGASVYVRDPAAGIFESSVQARDAAARIYESLRSPKRGDDLAFATTDAQGQFRFTDVPAAKDDLRVDVVVVAEGYALAWRHLPGGIAQEDVRVVLEPEAQLTGRVVDESGDPVPEATIRMRHSMSIRHITQADLEEGRWPRADDSQYVNVKGFRAPPSARTDADGHFTLSGLPTGLGLVLQVVHPRHALTEAFAATVKEIDAENAAKAKRNVQTGQVHVKLARARILNVQVVYEDTGAPAVGAQYPDLSTRSVRPPTLEVDSMGRFNVAHLTRRNVALFVYPPEGSDYLPQIDSVMFAEDVYEKSHIVKLKRGAVVTGRVVDDESGKGIEAVPLRALRRVMSPLHARHIPPHNGFETRADGTFHIVTVPGEVIVAVDGRVPGYLTSQGNSPLRNSSLNQQQVTASMDAPVEGVVIKLHQAPTVSGMVYDPEGQPAAGVSITGQIRLETHDSGTTYLSLDKRSDEQGRFSLDELHAAWRPNIAPQSVEVMFRDRLRNLGQLVSIDPPTERDDRERALDVRLQPLGTVTGRFINADSGQPIPDVRVSLYKRRGGVDSRSWHSVSPELRSGRDGRFELPGVFEGAEHSLNITDGRFRRFSGLSTSFIGHYGERHDAGDLELVPVEPPASQQLPPIEAPSIQGLAGEDAYEVLVRGYAADSAAYRQALKEAAAGRERDHVVARREPTPVYAEAFRELAEAHRGSNVELRSLTWIVNCRLTMGSVKEVRPLKAAAAQRLMDAYIDRKELADCVEVLLIYPKDALNAHDQSIATAERLLQENPHREVQGRTCYEIAQRLAFDHSKRVSPSDREQAIAYLQRVVEEFADIPHWRRGTLGEAARKDLFELQRLVVGARAPETTGTDLDGAEMSLSDFRGKVVVLDFWGSWCGPCIFELPTLNKIAQEFGDDVVVLGVMSDPPDKAKEAVDEHEVQFRNWVDGKSSEGPIANQWNIDSWPTVYVLDEQGVIRHKDLHGVSLRDAVWKLLQK